MTTRAPLVLKTPRHLGAGEKRPLLRLTRGEKPVPGHYSKADVLQQLEATSVHCGFRLTGRTGDLKATVHCWQRVKSVGKSEHYDTMTFQMSDRN